MVRDMIVEPEIFRPPSIEGSAAAFHSQTLPCHITSGVLWRLAGSEDLT